MSFDPKYTITQEIASALMRIEAARERVAHQPLHPTVLASLRSSARLYTTHYSTMIEGNKLKLKEIQLVIEEDKQFGRTRDEKEVKGYYAALMHMEKFVARGEKLSEKFIQQLHALELSSGKQRVQQTPYRSEQNVIKSHQTGALVYMPPEASDVVSLMGEMVNFLVRKTEVPLPILAGIAHYQFVTIHPYLDGNGRTARLLATFILHNGGYDLKGLYSLEEYYAYNLNAYYDAITIGSSHNYYLGRRESDITSWLTYFTEGMAVAFENVLRRMGEAGLSGYKDYSPEMRELDPKKRKVLELFGQADVVTAADIGLLFNFQPRTRAALCKKWVEDGFLQIENPSNKARSYRLVDKYKKLVT